MVRNSMSRRYRILAATEFPIKNRSFRVVLCDEGSFQQFEILHSQPAMAPFSEDKRWLETRFP